MTYLDYLPEIGKKTQARFAQALADLTYYHEIREKVEDGKHFVIFYALDKDAVNYEVGSEKAAFAYARDYGKDCQIFKLLPCGKALEM